MKQRIHSVLQQGIGSNVKQTTATEVQRTHGVFELLADRADDRQRLLELGGQLVCIHVSQAEHVAHLQPETGPERVS